MLFPKKVKHRKWQTRRTPRAHTQLATRGTTVAFGGFGLKSLGYARVTSNQIESARKVIRRALGKNGNMWTRIFPDRPYTAKGAEVGMGKGKGDPQGFVCEVLAGRMLFEVDGVSEAIAREALRKGGTKMPLKTHIVVRA